MQCKHLFCYLLCALSAGAVASNAHLTKIQLTRNTPIYYLLGHKQFNIKVQTSTYHGPIIFYNFNKQLHLSFAKKITITKPTSKITGQILLIQNYNGNRQIKFNIKHAKLTSNTTQTELYGLHGKIQYVKSKLPSYNASISKIITNFKLQSGKQTKLTMSGINLKGAQDEQRQTNIKHAIFSDNKSIILGAKQLSITYDNSSQISLSTKSLVFLKKQIPSTKLYIKLPISIKALSNILNP